MTRTKASAHGRKRGRRQRGEGGGGDPAVVPPSRFQAEKGRRDAGCPLLMQT